jgi:hypothetical protein
MHGPPPHMGRQTIVYMIEHALQSRNLSCLRSPPQVMDVDTEASHPMIPPVRGWTGPDWTSPGLVQSSPRSFWTGIGPVLNSVGPGLDWSGLAWTSPALCPGLGYNSHCIGLLMGEIYLDGTEYTDRTVIISPRAGIQR